MVADRLVERLAGEVDRLLNEEMEVLTPTSGCDASPVQAQHMNVGGEVEVATRDEQEDQLIDFELTAPSPRSVSDASAFTPCAAHVKVADEVAGYAVQCECGKYFMEDSAFCWKCGLRRPQVASPWPEVVLEDDVAEGSTSPPSRPAEEDSESEHRLGDFEEKYPPLPIKSAPFPAAWRVFQPTWRVGRTGSPQRGEAMMLAKGVVAQLSDRACSGGNSPRSVSPAQRADAVLVETRSADAATVHRRTGGNEQERAGATASGLDCTSNGSSDGDARSLRLDVSGSDSTLGAFRARPGVGENEDKDTPLSAWSGANSMTPLSLQTSPVTPFTGRSGASPRSVVWGTTKSPQAIPQTSPSIGSAVASSRQPILDHDNGTGDGCSPASLGTVPSFEDLTILPPTGPSPTLTNQLSWASSVASFSPERKTHLHKLQEVYTQALEGASASPATPSGVRLRKVDEERLNRGAKIRKDFDSLQESEHSFAPQITRRAARLSRGNPGGSPTESQLSPVGEPTKRSMRLSQLREEVETREFAECTFKPQITAVARKQSRSHASGAPPPTPEPTIRAQCLERMKAEREKKESEECTFNPKINRNSRAYLEAGSPQSTEAWHHRPRTKGAPRQSVAKTQEPMPSDRAAHPQKKGERGSGTGTGGAGRGDPVDSPSNGLAEVSTNGCGVLERPYGMGAVQPRSPSSVDYLNAHSTRQSVSSFIAGFGRIAFAPGGRSSKLSPCPSAGECEDDDTEDAPSGMAASPGSAAGLERHEAPGVPGRGAMKFAQAAALRQRVAAHSP